MAERLTNRGIAALKPSDMSVLHFDSEVSGLAVRIYPSGQKSFVFDWRENHRQRRKTIGQFPAWTIGKARTHASRLRLKADTGETIAPGRGGRLTDLIEQWRAVVKLTRRSGTVVGYSLASTITSSRPSARTSHGRSPATASKRGTARWRKARRSGQSQSGCAVVVHDMAGARQEGDSNPCRGIRRCPENQRHVFLDADEIKAAHRALSGDNIRSAALALRLALLTGCRIGEAIGLTADQIDAARKLWIKPASTTKQKKLHIVPLQPEALNVAQELLRIGLPDYETCKRCWERARKIIGREDVRIHDPATFTRLGARSQRRIPAANWAGAGPYRTGNDKLIRASGCRRSGRSRRACVIDDGPQSQIG